MTYAEIREALAVDIRAGRCPLEEAAIAAYLADRNTAGLTATEARAMARRFLAEVQQAQQGGDRILVTPFPDGNL